jgi:hypothetical protein
VKVIISEIQGFREDVLARGLVSMLSDLGVNVDAPVAASEHHETQPRVPKPAVSRRPTKSSAKQAAVIPARAPAADPERLTIRQRIINYLRSGPKRSDEVRAELEKQGVSTSASLASQHLYLLGKAKIAVRDDDSDQWRLRNAA